MSFTFSLSRDADDNDDENSIFKFDGHIGN